MRVMEVTPVRQFIQALRDAAHDWRAYLATGLFYHLIAVAILSPLAGLFTRYVISRSGSAALTDVDIARFLLATPAGVTGLILVAAITITIAALEQKAFMGIGLGNLQGQPVRPRHALTFAASKAWPTLRLAALLTIRILLLVLPFAALLGAVYWVFLRAHDINYYLTDRPREFWVALGLGGAMVGMLALVLARRIAGWLLALPLVAFEGVAPRAALGESDRRMTGHRKAAAAALLLLAGGWVVAGMAGGSAFVAAARWMSPLFSGSVAAMLLFTGLFLVAWTLGGLLIAIAAATVLAQLMVRYYMDSAPAPVSLADSSPHLSMGGERRRVGWPVLVGGLALCLGVAIFLAQRLMKDTWASRPVVVMAHRGASGERPENTLAAFRLAAEQGTDYVELDVQESADGMVLVGHDADLMKVGRSPLRIWQSPAAELRAVDIGSYFDPSFAGERVPTLAETLDLLRGKARLNIELKDYGHDDQLESRVVALVEAAGMEDQVVTMSLSHRMVREMERLRPGWTSGLLLAKTIGDASKLDADFLAVPTRVATRRFIRRAHAAGKPVYAWTVNDPQMMIRLVGYGVDGLITNYPALARAVVTQYEELDPAERMALFAMARLGGKAPVAEPDSLLRY